VVDRFGVRTPAKHLPRGWTAAVEFARPTSGVGWIGYVIIGALAQGIAGMIMKIREASWWPFWWASPAR
jgi:hypothetical protein